MVKHFLTALTIFTPFVSTQQVHEDFSTFETASTFNDAFGDLTGYLLGEVLYNSIYEFDYDGGTYIYYALPIYYDIEFIDADLELYYSNDTFNFYLNNLNQDGVSEGLLAFNVVNYIGVAQNFSFGRLNSEAMITYIDNEKGTEVVSDIIGTIGSMVTGILGGIGTGVVGMFTSLFMDGSNISSLGIWVIVLLGLSIALGAVAWVSTLIRGKQR